MFDSDDVDLLDTNADLFNGEADRDLATLVSTDVDIEPLYLEDRGPNWWVQGETELELIAACERQIAFLHAMQSRALVRFAALRPGHPGQLTSEFAPDEVALGVRWTKAVAGSRLSLAFTLAHRLPGTLRALEEGQIDLRRAQKLAEVTDPLPVAVARQVEEAVLPDAGEQDSSELARAARKAVARLDPQGAQERHEQRKQDRKVELIPRKDAMAELCAYLSAADAVRIHRMLNNYARAKVPGDRRSMDQRRADVLTDLLLNPGGRGAGNTGGAGVVVQVTMPATMLMGLNEQAADLAGYGPIPAEMARALAADSVWRRLLTDPMTGQLLDYGRTTYRPPAALADFIRARDHHCVFPGCHRPADACDLDHKVRYPDGPTSEHNIHCLCRHHHRLKHQGGWSVEYRNGVHIWTSPQRRRYHRRPVPIATPTPPPAPVQVAAHDDPPPF